MKSTESTTKCFDVFNGDADGICSLVQIRRKFPRDSVLVTGVKRDIRLLERIRHEENAEILVLDISMKNNRDALLQVLEQKCSVRYFDHHNPGGEIPSNDHLDARIDTQPNTCTSLIVDDWLNGAYGKWAIAGAFGDNLDGAARVRCEALDIDESDAGRLRLLGRLLNYNAYGASIEDLLFHPAKLYQHCIAYTDPLEFMSAEIRIIDALQEQYESDLTRARKTPPEFETECVAIFRLPDAPWSRRISGIFGNELAREHPDRAHAILTHNAQGGFTVSIRAPLNTPLGADAVASHFPTGGGRAKAAGINQLPETEHDRFINEMKNAWSV